MPIEPVAPSEKDHTTMKEPCLLRDTQFQDKFPELAAAARWLRQGQHSKTLASFVRKSYEHAYPLDDYAKKAAQEALEAAAVLQRFGASAFDEGTVQDLKYHRKADELYLVLQGAFRILWKSSGPPKLDRKTVLEVSAGSSPWALIPSGHCLMVLPASEAPFLAVAFKTEKSTIENGGKQLGASCDQYHQCPNGQDCEEIKANRGGFFDAVAAARQARAKDANTIAQHALDLPA